MRSGKRALLPHERELLAGGLLEDVTHAGASAVWLRAPSAADDAADATTVRVYRVMGDAEFAALRGSGQLPATQPYQTIVCGDEGRSYCERYLTGTKRVDSAPTTVVEFRAPAGLVARLFAQQSKPEDGVLSHGLGDKGGRGLPLFNASLASGEISWRVVTVKRRPAGKQHSR